MVEVNRPLIKFHLTDDRPLTAGGETTFELIDHYLMVLMQDIVDGRLICCVKTGPKCYKVPEGSTPICWRYPNFLKTLGPVYDFSSEAYVSPPRSMQPFRWGCLLAPPT